MTCMQVEIQLQSGTQDRCVPPSTNEKFRGSQVPSPHDVRSRQVQRVRMRCMHCNPGSSRPKAACCSPASTFSCRLNCCCSHSCKACPPAAVATSAVAALPAAQRVPPLVAASTVAAHIPAAKRAPPPVAASTVAALPAAKRAPPPKPHDCPHHTTCVQGKCTECACAACTATQAVAGVKRVSRGNARYG